MPNRMWCATGAYPGKARFIFGTVVARDRQDALTALAALWADTMHCPPPDWEPIPGELVFREGD